MSEKRKQLMKTALRVVFVIAWLPILWLFLSATIGNALSMFVGQTWIIQSLILGLSLLLIFFAFRYLTSLSEKIFGEK
ncbi:MAG: hypothetical protein MI684_02380 [Chlorobiales bacterium]|nr:hypothetical protein [Chlorobiales bacterium]